MALNASELRENNYIYSVILILRGQRKVVEIMYVDVNFEKKPSFELVYSMHNI
jgi:hypothetical protein